MAGCRCLYLPRTISTEEQDLIVFHLAQLQRFFIHFFLVLFCLFVFVHGLTVQIFWVKLKRQPLTYEMHALTTLVILEEMRARLEDGSAKILDLEIKSIVHCCCGRPDGQMQVNSTMMG